MSLDGETHVVEGWFTYPDCAVCTRPLHPGNVDAHTAWHARQLRKATA